jgi:hypothetical protein
MVRDTFWMAFNGPPEEQAFRRDAPGRPDAVMPPLQRPSEQLRITPCTRELAHRVGRARPGPLSSRKMRCCSVCARAGWGGLSDGLAAFFVLGIVLKPSARANRAAMPYPYGERGGTVAPEAPHTKRGGAMTRRLRILEYVYTTGRALSGAGVAEAVELALSGGDFGHLCATGRVMPAAMPTDAAADANGDTRRLRRRWRRPTAAAPIPQAPRHRPSLGGSPISGLLAEEAARGEQRQQQRRI